MLEIANALLKALAFIMGTCIICNQLNMLDAMNELIITTKCLVVLEAKKEGSEVEV